MVVDEHGVGEPCVCFLLSNLLDLIENVYPDLYYISTKTSSWFQERAILSSTNDQVNKINNIILSKFNAPTKVDNSRCFRYRGGDTLSN